MTSVVPVWDNNTMPEMDYLIAQLMTKLADHDILIELKSDQKNMIVTLTNYIENNNIRLSDLEQSHRKLELRVNAGFAGLLVVMWFVNHFFK